MTGIAAWCSPPAENGEGLVSQLLALQSLRGSEASVFCPEPGIVVGAAPFDWQTEWTGTGIGRCGPVTVTADATLYYISDLLAALHREGVHPASHFPADLIAAAVVAWGEGAATRLEGDFAFVAVNSETRQTVAARDWSGLRSLYFAATERTIAFASEASPLARMPGVDSSLNLPWLAEAAAGRFESRFDSAFLGVQLVPAGSLVRVDLNAQNVAKGVTRVTTFVPPTFLGDKEPAVPFDEARVELRALMEAAVRERLPASGGLSVALSGGRDSPAVYALARQLVGDRVKSMSVTYPEGDPGREDDIILDVLRMCGGEPHWIEAVDLPILATVRESSAQRHEPFAHAFAEFQEALARAARLLGTRVLLNGSGGDQFFSGEPTYLADLLRGGKLRTLRREWRALGGGRDWRAFFKFAIWPNLGPISHATIKLLRGRSVADPFDRRLPDWIRQDFADSAGLDARHRANFPSRQEASGAADFERRWLLAHPYFPRVFAEAFRLFLKEGVELRTPLADARLLRFAATRPRWERREGWQMKKLMRASLTDVLPHSVTGDRPRPTGTTEGLLTRALQSHLAALIEETHRSSALSELGILDSATLFRARNWLARGSDPSAALEAVSTVFAEEWVRVQVGRSFPASDE